MATSKKYAGPATKGLQVTARRDSFWRGGQHFSHEPKTVSLAELTAEQAGLIREEGLPGGQLVVTEVDIEAVKA